MPKRILVLSFYFEPDLSAGSFRCTSLVNALLEHQNCQIDVITTLPNRYNSFSVSAPEYEEKENCTIQRIKIPTHQSGMKDQIRSYITYYREVKKRVKNQNYDLIFVTSGRLFSAFLGAQLSRKKQTPLYLDIRDIFVDTLTDILSRKIAWFVVPACRLIEKYTFSTAKRINLVSEGFIPYFKQYPQPEYRFYTNGIDANFLESNTSQNNQITRKTPHITALYAGNIGEGQGLHLILPELAKQLQDKVSFIVIGDGGQKARLSEHIQGLTNVTLLPPTNRSALQQAYQSADILFLHLNDYPAFHKVLPSKIFEYAASGKPIWAGVSGYAAHFLTKHVSNVGIFSPCNTIEALNALERLHIEDSDRTAFREKFSRKKIMHNMSSDILSFLEKT
jgi:glycosyltransferase involved in cell wall biosynthesis